MNTREQSDAEWTELRKDIESGKLWVVSAEQFRDWKGRLEAPAVCFMILGLVLAAKGFYPKVMDWVLIGAGILSCWLAWRIHEMISDFHNRIEASRR